MHIIPRIKGSEKEKKGIKRLRKRLKQNGFYGTIEIQESARLSLSTDNSIYQVVPTVIICPKSTQDIQLLCQQLQCPDFQDLHLTPRGGGTGTNGQSLSNGICLDCSQYMNQILEIDIDKEWVRVQPGVILDQLNDALRPHGYFFAPHVSASGQATIGGMISTDACGKGSSRYGRTANHVQALEIVLSNGTTHLAKPISSQTREKYEQGKGQVAKIYQDVNRIVEEKASQIDRVYPHIQRYLTGYNLADIKQGDQFSLIPLLAGSEGTLGIFTEAKLKIVPIPKYRHMVVLGYPSFIDALKDVKGLVKASPLAIESSDDVLLRIIQNQTKGSKIATFFGGEATIPVKAINIVECAENNKDELDQQIQQIIQTSAANTINETSALSTMASVWRFRHEAVGLIEKAKSKTRPIPFIEDTAVDPSQLVPYISALQAIFIESNVDVAMYGHADAGCIHVRPYMDLNTEDDKVRLKILMSKVAQIVMSFQGVMWGEHGRGYRSDYTEQFFGKIIFECLRQVKTVFDPKNQMNPGKIVSPFPGENKVVSVTETLKADRDIQVNTTFKTLFNAVFDCNGNGICVNYDVNQLMCPSYKVTRDHIHSPKGRAILLREWVRRLSEKQYIPTPIKKWRQMINWPVRVVRQILKYGGQQDLSHEVYQAMDGCLNCHACDTDCPVQISIPEYKSRFLSLYHTRYGRPIRDYLIANIEKIVMRQIKIPWLYNGMLKNRVMTLILKKGLGLLSPPRLSNPSIHKQLKKKKVTPFILKRYQNSPKKLPENTIFLLQDAVTSAFEANMVMAAYGVLDEISEHVKILPIMPSGKPMHVKGFLASYEQEIKKNVRYLNQVHDNQYPIIGIEPSMVQQYRTDYKASGLQPKILGLQDYLFERRVQLKDAIGQNLVQNNYYLMSHCSEKSNKDTEQAWCKLFTFLGVTLQVIESGCCGMAGAYGFEAHHEKNSKSLFKQGWEPHLLRTEEGVLFVTGFSCRTQVRACSQYRTCHPITLLYQSMIQTKNS